MLRLEGRALVKGQAIGFATRSQYSRIVVEEHKVRDPEGELKFYLQTIKNLKRIIANSKKTKTNLEDLDILWFIENENLENDVRKLIIRRHLNAMYAVERVCKKMSQAFLVMQTPEFHERGENIQKSRNLILEELHSRLQDFQNVAKYEKTILLLETLNKKNLSLLKNKNNVGFLLQKAPRDCKITKMIKKLAKPVVVLGEDIHKIFDGVEITIFEEMVGF